MPRKDNAMAWYEYALATGDDSVARFMMNWIAFNWIYCKCRGESERFQIENLCKERQRDLERYDPFDDCGAVKVFKERPILDNRRKNKRRIDPIGPHQMDPWQLHNGICNGDGLMRIQCLLLAVYQVRCNLFHGSKEPHDTRDQDLVRSSATIMQGYMEALLHIDSSSRKTIN